MLLAILAALLGAEVRHCLYYENDSFTLVPLEDKGSDCVATTVSDIEALNETGWMRFNVTTSASYPDFVQMRAVGFAEGKLFQHQIFNHYHNLKDWFLFAYLHTDDYPQELYDFLQENLDWTRTSAYKYAEVDSFWRQVAYTLDHFDGLVEAYRATAPPEEMLSEIELWTYLSSGDLLDIVNFAVPSTRMDFSKMTREEISDYLALRSHCSGLVYFNEDDIYVGQTAWFFYGGMTRVFKGYTLNLNDYSNAAETLTFSSYPGFSYSFDDWTVTSQGLVIIETTANVLNTSLYDNCTPRSVLTWIRSQVASRSATSGDVWHQIISQYNSGTYNNQWIVVDLKKSRDITTGYKNNLVWVSEQMPGYIVADDVAYDMACGNHYFPSYNTPFFDELWIVAGYPSVAENDASYRYDKNPRGLMFARDAPGITGVEDMKRIMRYNRWQTDPLAITEGQTDPDPGNGISARYDLRLDESRRKAFGGYDAKILTYNAYSRKMVAYFISGPTTDDQEPWDFSTSNLYCPRRGLKDGPYQYDWQELHLPVYWHSDM